MLACLGVLSTGFPWHLTLGLKREINYIESILSFFIVIMILQAGFQLKL